MNAYDLNTKGQNQQKIGETVAVLIKKYGGQITSGQLLNEAAKKRSPLHNLFDWNDTEAANKWRKMQAENLIRSVHITYEDQSGPVTIRAFVNTEPQIYKPIISAMANIKDKSKVLNDALYELNCWKNKYNNLSEFSRLLGDIDDLNNRYGT